MDYKKVIESAKKTPTCAPVRDEKLHVGEKELVLTLDGLNVADNPYAFDRYAINMRLQRVISEMQEDKFKWAHRDDYVPEKDRPLATHAKEKLFAKNVHDKYQGLLDRIRKEEHINRKNEKYKKFREDLQSIEVVAEK